MELREFTKTDWYAFAGAESWPRLMAEDAPPLIAEGRFDDGMGWVLVLDRAGACLVCEDEQAAFGGYGLDRRFPSPADARAFAAALGEPKTLSTFLAPGFTPF